MPFKKSLDPKTARFELKLTPFEKASIEAAARERHLTVSEFVLRRALGKQAPVHFDVDAIDVLEKLVQELRLAYRDGVAGGAAEEIIARWKDLAGDAILALWQRK